MMMKWHCKSNKVGMFRLFLNYEYYNVIMNIITVTGYSFRMMWKIMEISEGVICLIQNPPQSA